MFSIMYGYTPTIFVLSSDRVSNNHANNTGISFSRKDGLNTKFELFLSWVLICIFVLKVSFMLTH